MPRYYFDIDDGARAMRDEEGTDLPDISAARDAAIGLLPNIARDELPDGDTHEFVTIVRLEDGRAVFRARLSLTTEWLEPDPDPAP